MYKTEILTCKSENGEIETKLFLQLIIITSNRF